MPVWFNIKNEQPTMYAAHVVPCHQPSKRRAEERRACHPPVGACPHALPHLWATRYRQDKHHRGSSFAGRLLLHVAAYSAATLDDHLFHHWASEPCKPTPSSLLHELHVCSKPCESTMHTQATCVRPCIHKLHVCYPATCVQPCIHKLHVCNEPCIHKLHVCNEPCIHKLHVCNEPCIHKLHVCNEPCIHKLHVCNEPCIHKLHVCNEPCIHKLHVCNEPCIHKLHVCNKPCRSTSGARPPGCFWQRPPIGQLTS